MKKNIWILNHYATNMIEDKAGRHYWLAENLILNGYKPTIFCASTLHNSNKSIDTEGNLFVKNESGDVPFVVVKTPQYSGNGKKRIINMISFYKNLFPTAKNYAKLNGKPDIILASSVHPLTLVAGIKIAKKLGVPCICEVRDLWPESIVAYGSLKRNSVRAKILYQGEKWIYKKANKLIFTMEGGKDYIIEQGWGKENGGPIDIDKVYHINNGINLVNFTQNREEFSFVDEDLDNKDIFKVIYTGSIRKVNDVNYLIEVAKEIELSGAQNIKVIIYGDGNDKDKLVERCKTENITSVIFKGRVPKHQIPYILSKSDLNILHFQQNNIKKYGASLNKLFEYFASGKPIISDCEFGYDLIKRYDCGVVVDSASPKEIAEEIIKIKNFSLGEYNTMCINSFIAAQDYDFSKLTAKLLEII
ncbi:glycosyltransferase family 4 protein [Anoxynatronum sibiricum]|uniref:Glycosyltransferase family 4 protein n=1 Tax=Anoxynatronum sibiricum TaxID=210623 RepID=A0ABU9W081_9CLOT